jgi:mono/diheme cytochrome c family protein
MNPRPRNFQQGNFKLSTTVNQVPTDADLLRVLENGMPGSAMPPWKHLPKADLVAMVAQVRKFQVEATQAMLKGWVADGSMKEDELPKALVERTTPGALLAPPAEPGFDESRWFRGRRLYLENCASCHGASGEPVASEVKFDAEGYPVPPRSFVQGIFKGGSEGHQLYARILRGLKGTPMPGSEGVYSAEEIWDLVHYVQSLARPGAQDRAALKSGTLKAIKRASLATGPIDSAWDEAPSTYVALTPLWWSEQRVDGVMVQAMHDAGELAIRLQWIDPTQDDSAVGHHEFRDAAAIQFSLTPEPPFFMGDPTEHGGVNLWMWKADRERNIREGYRDIDGQYPDSVVDYYPEESYQITDMSVVDWPRKQLAALNPLFAPAWAVGNLAATPELKTPTECLVAKGPGTLSGKAPELQVVGGKAEYQRGVWYVQLQRQMSCPHGHGEKDEAVFLSGATMPVSFAIWDGAAGDRAGKKNISTWQTMAIE